MVLKKCGLFLVSCCLIVSPTIFAQEIQSATRFSDYLLTLKQEAITLGISESTIASAFPKIKRFRKAVVTNDDSLEGLTLETYLPNRVTETNVLTARALYKEHYEELNVLGKKYGVQPRFIVSMWGIESNFGAHLAHYPVLSVTASLAYNKTNEPYHKAEFFSALKILDNGQLEYSELLASGEGGLGLMQMSASHYLSATQDSNGDGSQNIWSDSFDAMALAAAYLQGAGWKSQETWGRQVLTPEGFDEALVGLSTQKTFSQWSELGITRFDGSQLPKRDDMQISLIMPDGITGRKYLVYDNFRALLTWKNSAYFAVSVAYLSERIKYPPIE
ncbi:lytic transglycosylase domain-containing protein [Shewanella sp. UCD-KL12]|uniref:lytic murein transglycosylase n=1 Tax=Shewanella sp. UCD-KL12 TaxID=1917163 RepID=UPI0009F98AA8|nr:lytic murein transglycosylase [Shewanella sp. UCD-KL12]